MADKTLDSESFYLYDTLPGPVNPKLGPPTDGFTGAESHNVASAAYHVGTKVSVYNTGTTGVEGKATFCYGQLTTQDTTIVLAARHICSLHSGAVPFLFTNDDAADIGASVSPAVVGLGAMTIAYYGWFWCGGICPEEFVSDLGGSYYTTTNATIGPMTTGELATEGTTAGEIGFDYINASDVDWHVAYAYVAAA